MKRYILYLLRWQSSGIVLAPILEIMKNQNVVLVTIIANLIGGMIFYWVDKKIFKEKKMDNNLNDIINHFGLKNQLIKLNEEIGELIVACMDNNCFQDDVIEELADAHVLLRQIQLFYNIKDKQIKKVMKEKTNRTIERIGSDYYKNHR